MVSENSPVRPSASTWPRASIVARLSAAPIARRAAVSVACAVGDAAATAEPAINSINNRVAPTRILQSPLLISATNGAIDRKRGIGRFEGGRLLDIPRARNRNPPPSGRAGAAGRASARAGDRRAPPRLGLYRLAHPRPLSRALRRRRGRYGGAGRRAPPA